MPQEQVFGSALGTFVLEETTDHPPLPLTWWDHVKQDLAPPWFRRRFAVRMLRLTKTVTVTHMCPHSNRVDERHHLRFLMK